jgi:hypothetical protein
MLLQLIRVLRAMPETHGTPVDEAMAFIGH